MPTPYEAHRNPLASPEQLRDTAPATGVRAGLGNHPDEGFGPIQAAQSLQVCKVAYMGLGVLEGTKPSQVDGFEVGWRDAKGEHRLPLADAVSVPFEAGRPVRDFPSYRGQRHFPGLYWSSTTGGHVGFELIVSVGSSNV